MMAGAVAGVVASFVMTRFHVAISGRGLTDSEEPQSKKPVDGQDDVAMKTADLAAQSATGQPLTQEEKKEVGGPLAHYAFGAAVGAAYGVIGELAPRSPFARGGPFGAAVWLIADQIGLPLVGLTPWPLKTYPLSTNFQHLLSHLVYGVTTAQTFRAIRST
jgi:putative membrane protein